MRLSGEQRAAIRHRMTVAGFPHGIPVDHRVGAWIRQSEEDKALLLEALEEAEREVERLRAGLVEMGRAILDRDEE